MAGLKRFRKELSKMLKIALRPHRTISLGKSKVRQTIKQTRWQRNYYENRRRRLLDAGLNARRPSKKSVSTKNSRETPKLVGTCQKVIVTDD